MKNKEITRSWLFIVVLYLLTLFGCSSTTSTINFYQIEQGNEEHGMINDTVIAVKSYSLRYNPSANGAIEITLTNDAKYLASRLNASQVSSLLNLLNTNGLQFDTKTEEFTLKVENNE